MAKTRQTAARSTGGRIPRKELNQLLRRAEEAHYDDSVVVSKNIPEDMLEVRIRSVSREYVPGVTREPFVVKYGDSLPAKERRVGISGMEQLLGRFNTKFLQNMQNAMRDDLKLTEEEMMVLGFQDVDVTEGTIDRQSSYWNALVFCDWSRPPHGREVNPKFFYMPAEDYVADPAERGRVPGYIYAIRSPTSDLEGQHWRTQLCTVSLYSEEDFDKVVSDTASASAVGRASPAVREASARPGQSASPTALQASPRRDDGPSSSQGASSGALSIPARPQPLAPSSFRLRGDETVVYISDSDSDNEQPLRRSSKKSTRRVFRRPIYNCVIDVDGEFDETDEAGSAHMKIMKWLMNNPNRIWTPRAASYRDAQPGTAQLHLTMYPNPSIHTGRRCMIFSIQYAMARLTSMRFAAAIFNGVNPNSLRTFHTISLLLRNQRRSIFSLVKSSTNIRELPKGQFVVHIRAKCMKKNNYGSNRGDVIDHCVYADTERRIIIDPVEMYAIPFHPSSLHYCVGENYKLMRVVEVRAVEINVAFNSIDDLFARLESDAGSRKKARRSIKKKRSGGEAGSSSHYPGKSRH